MTDTISVRSFLETVRIDAISHRLATSLAEDFSAAEQRLQPNPPIQSVAGRLALKRALCRTAAECFGLRTLRPRDITIDTGEDGAPRIGTIDARDTAVARAIRDLVFISISHSKTTAAGLAVVRDRIHA